MFIFRRPGIDTSTPEAAERAIELYGEDDPSTTVYEAETAPEPVLLRPARRASRSPGRRLSLAGSTRTRWRHFWHATSVPGRRTLRPQQQERT